MKSLEKYKDLIVITVVINLVVSLVLWFVLFPEIRGGSLAEVVTDLPSSKTDSVVVDIVKQANPAVLSISVLKEVPVSSRGSEEMSPFDFFWAPFRTPQRDMTTEEREVGGGSGFIVSPDGLVVTNKHVVSDTAARYQGTSSTGEQYDLEVIARDQFMDIAVLRIVEAPLRLPYLEFGDSSNLSLGETVIAIGNALNEFRNSVSVGVVSGLSRSVVAGSSFGEIEQLEEVIQTDAAINPGNSGGPLLDLAGRVVGVNVAVALGSENIGFALPANSVQRIVASIEEYGEIVRPYLGVRYVPITPALASTLHLPVDRGALLAAGGPGEEAVIGGSPAADAGLREDDIIVAVEGVEINENRSLGSLIQGAEVGESVLLEVLRDNQRFEIEVTLERAPNTIN